MKYTLYQVDAFTDALFHGNPAAVCPLREWLPDEVMQAIAEENNLAETVFFVPTEDGEYHIRWFTPVMEINLCGHATLAAAHVLFTELEPGRESVTFRSLAGPLGVVQEGDMLSMNFPAWRPKPLKSIPSDLLEGLIGGPRPIAVLHTRDYLVVYEDAEAVRKIAPVNGVLARLDAAGVIVTAPGAPGTGYDFVSRFFNCELGMPEDPVTGSAHTTLTPYWAERLEKNVLKARQLSTRGGELQCELHGNRVRIAGKAVTFMKAKFRLES